MTRTALFVFAHQDDEVVAATRIARERERGHRVRCIYLTDGGARGIDPARRDAESLAVLDELGVPVDDVTFGERVPDGELVLSLDLALTRLTEAAAGDRVDRLYCLAFEGGHHDHDASHLVALAFAQRLGLLRCTWQLPFYTGAGAPGKLFRVLRPVADLPAYTRRLTRREAMRSSRLGWRYPSQRRTWIGLFPEFFVRRGLQRREIIQPVAPPRRPDGTPLYESLFGFGADRFWEAAAPFVADLTW